MKNLIIFYLAFSILSVNAITFDDFVLAINKVETGGKTSAILGDYDKISKTYKALGSLQIHFVCWKDAVEFNPSIKGKYQDCADFKYSKKVMEAYFRRYVPDFNPLSTLTIKDCERMARVWSGGPVGYKKDSTIKYWNKVKAALDNSH